MVKKFIPGAGYTQYWYDRAGRLAFMRNGGVRRLQRHGLKADGVYGKVDMALFPGGYAYFASECRL